VCRIPEEVTVICLLRDSFDLHKREVLERGLRLCSYGAGPQRRPHQDVPIEIENGWIPSWAPLRCRGGRSGTPRKYARAVRKWAMPGCSRGSHAVIVKMRRANELRRSLMRVSSLCANGQPEFCTCTRRCSAFSFQSPLVRYCCQWNGGSSTSSGVPAGLATDLLHLGLCPRT